MSAPTGRVQGAARYYVVHPAIEAATQLNGVFGRMDPKNRIISGEDAIRVMETFTMPRRRSNADVYEALSSLSDPLTIAAKLRLFDVVGSSNDLPKWQVSFGRKLLRTTSTADYNNPFGEWGKGNPTLSACLSNIPVILEFSAAKDRNTIEYIAPDYNIATGVWDFKEKPLVPTGSTALAPYFILGNIYGLRGIRVSMLPTELPGNAGLESSNAFVWALFLAGAALGKTGEGQAELFSRAVHTANESLGDHTGGQGISAAILGGYHAFKYIVEKGMLGFLGHEVVPTSGYAAIEEHIDLVQPGKDFGIENDRSAKANNDAWCDAMETEFGFLEQSRIPRLGIEFTRALHDATVNGNEAAWEYLVTIGREQTRIRSSIGEFYFKGQEEFVRTVERMGGLAFALGAGGLGAMYAVLGPRGLKDRVREIYGLGPITGEVSREIVGRGGFLKGFVPYKIDRTGTEMTGFEEAGLGPIPAPPVMLEI